MTPGQPPILRPVNHCVHQYLLSARHQLHFQRHDILHRPLFRSLSLRCRLSALTPLWFHPWKPWLRFNGLPHQFVLCALYNLSDDQVEYQRRDRLSFVRFLGLRLEYKVPDAKTVWLYREQLSQAGVIDALFKDFDGYLTTRGSGQAIDKLFPICANSSKGPALAQRIASPWS